MKPTKTERIVCSNSYVKVIVYYGKNISTMEAKERAIYLLEHKGEGKYKYI